MDILSKSKAAVFVEAGATTYFCQRFKMALYLKSVKIQKQQLIFFFRLIFTLFFNIIGQTNGMNE